MKTVILAGGLGTRIAEETHLKPKPMIEIGGRPILWHIVFTYGDGLADADICSELAFHRFHGKLATVLAVQPPGRHGALEIRGTMVEGFTEKPRGDGGLIDGGFFVLSPRCLELIEGDHTSWEVGPLNELAAHGQLERPFNTTASGRRWTRCATKL